jgi:hypothetical protein
MIMPAIRVVSFPGTFKFGKFPGKVPGDFEIFENFP